MIKSQYQDAVKFIKERQPHFTYIETISSEDETVNALLAALNVVSVEISCGWHGDSHREKRVFLMSEIEAKQLK